MSVGRGRVATLPGAEARGGAAARVWKPDPAGV
jgi:hypothetical protein